LIEHFEIRVSRGKLGPGGTNQDQEGEEPGR